MTVLKWHYLDNQFENATDGSFKLMNIMNEDHLSRLQASAGEPTIDDLITRTIPVHNGYSSSYVAWITERAFYKGATNAQETLIDELSAQKIKEWDIQIQNVFLEGTSEYMSILPNRREPFQKGGIDDRITEVESLGERLESYPALTTTEDDVKAFHTQLEAARDAQQQREGAVETKSDLLETARLVIAWMMYRNLGILMDHFGEDVEQIRNYWEIGLFRDTAPGGEEEPGEPIIGNIAGGATVNILSEIPAGASFLLSNTGTTTLNFCTTGDVAGVCTAGAQLAGGEETTVLPEDIGAPGSAFLNVTNEDPAVEGSFQVIVVV